MRSISHSKMLSRNRRLRRIWLQSQTKKTHAMVEELLTLLLDRHIILKGERYQLTLLGSLKVTGKDRRSIRAF